MYQKVISALTKVFPVSSQITYAPNMIHLHCARRYCVRVVRKMFSSSILEEWERGNKVLVNCTSLKAPQLAKLLSMCGLGYSKLSVKKRRLLLTSCRHHKLPVDPKMVCDCLVNDYNQQTTGSYGKRLGFALRCYGFIVNAHIFCLMLSLC